MQTLKLSKQYVIYLIISIILNVIPGSIAFMLKNNDFEWERGFPLNSIRQERKPSKPYRPFRIIEDRVLRQVVQQPSSKPTRHKFKSVSARNDRFNDLTTIHSPKTSVRKRGINGIKLPINYIYPGFQQNTSDNVGDQVQIQKKSFAVSKQSQPLFDDDTDEEYTNAIPILIYTGSKGEMLFNTMLIVDNYPMFEPVPGQILHLPPTPSILRGKSLRVPHKYRTVSGPHKLRKNLTLIPFYAHEAIVKTHSLNFVENALPTSSSLTGVTSGEEWKGSDDDGDENRWHAYRSPNDVLKQPTRNVDLPKNNTASLRQLSSTVTPMRNHRWNSSEMDQVSTKQLMPMEDVSEAGFKITYTNNIQDSIDGNSLERPQPAETSSQRPDLERNSRISTVTHESHRPAISLTAGDTPSLLEQKRQKTSVRDVDDDCCSSETWLVLHSRYKGHHFKGDNKQRMSSKYFQV